MSGAEARVLSEQQVLEGLSAACDGLGIRDRRVLAIIPDNTRSAPIDLLFRSLHRVCTGRARRLDCLVALGTHPQLGEDELLKRIGLTREAKDRLYGQVGIHNHRWNLPGTFANIGCIEAPDAERLTGGLVREKIPVTINRMIFDYDLLVVLGPVFPHEIAGFSGAGKYLFPGISGPEVIDVTHWLGGLQTNLKTIGVRDTPVRALIECAARLIRLPILYVNLVVDGEGLKGLFAGRERAAWEQAVELSARLNIRQVDRPFRRVLSIPSGKYDDFWTGAKAFYKVEPIVEDGGELVVFAPQIRRISYTHDEMLNRIGFHVSQYHLAHLDHYGGISRTALGYSALVKGAGSYREGIERARVRVILASGVPEETCRRLNIDYLDPAAVRVADWENREAEGLYVVHDAGEVLYRVREAGP